MRLNRCPAGLYRSPLLSSESWLEHAFGTASATPPGPLLLLKQVHGTLIIDSSHHREGIEADGIATTQANLWATVKTADCVPILIADPDRRAVAAVHAGWRGTVAQIAARAVEHLRSAYGSRPENLIAAAGPSIGPCCFKVGPEVATQFAALTPDLAHLAAAETIDLRDANRRILLSAGLKDESIDCEAPCTCCNGTEFHSWRRDRIAGCRMYSSIRIR